MSDLDLYRIIIRYCNEYHEDGIFFVPPWNLKDFTTSLNIKDTENAIPAVITSDGYLAINTRDFESWFEEDIEEVIRRLNEDFNDYIVNKH